MILLFMVPHVQEEHDARLEKVLQRIQDKGLTLNTEKCKFHMSELESWDTYGQLEELDQRRQRLKQSATLGNQSHYQRSEVSLDLSITVESLYPTWQLLLNP
jgi:hypothetical protein